MARRGRRKKRRQKLRLRCEQCGRPVQEGEDGTHDSPYSKNGVTWDGLVVVAWCRYCGHEYASDS